MRALRAVTIDAARQHFRRAGLVAKARTLMSDIQHIPLNKLVASERNVRRKDRKADLDALARAGEAVALIIADQWMPGTNGIDFLQQAHELHASAQRALLVSDHVRSELAIGPVAVAFRGQVLRHVEHDRHGERVVLPRDLHEATPAFRLYVRRVDDREAGGGEALGGDVVQHVEGVRRRRLVSLVVGHDAAEEVG